MQKFKHDLREVFMVGWKTAAEKIQSIAEKVLLIVKTEIKLPGKRKRGSQRAGGVSEAKGGMKWVGVTEDNVMDRTSWRKKIRCSNP